LVLLAAPRPGGGFLLIVIDSLRLPRRTVRPLLDWQRWLSPAGVALAWRHLLLLGR